MLDKTNQLQPVWLDETSCDLAIFKDHIAQQSLRENYSLATDIISNVPVYDGDDMRRAMHNDTTSREVMAEWNRVFQSGPGIIVVRRGYADSALIDDVTAALCTIIEQEEAAGVGTGDHFATAGANSRIWNSHEKLCMQSPSLFAQYNSNELIRRISESWLGTGYQMTCQVNVVRPGGKAQTAHRDYHMGFQSKDTLERFPASQHALSAALTLQGAVAHTDMPVLSGPTKLLPYSQSYLPGYIAVLLPEFRDVFESSFVQVPLDKGDLLFFNPATFHAAGDNRTTDIQRMANLMQIGSTYGRSIEIVDRSRITCAVFNDLKQLLADEVLSAREADNVIAATAEGYPFPANLDIDSPLSGMAPPSQQDILRQALEQSWSLDRLKNEVYEQNARKRSH